MKGLVLGGGGSFSAAAVLGCIEAKFCKEIVNTHVKALAEIYTMHSFAPFSTTK